MDALDDRIMEKLRSLVVDSAEDVGVNPFTDFRIQYTVFEYHEDEDENSWYMNSTLTNSDEGIYSLDEIEYSDDGTTCVSVYSWKGNYDSFEHVECTDNRGQSTNHQVYACDLFPSFEPKNFKGECWTRGGFTGWNWIEI